MKEYLKKRIEELRQEKELWLFKLGQKEDEAFKICYLESIARLNECLDLLAEVERREKNE